MVLSEGTKFNITTMEADALGYLVELAVNGTDTGFVHKAFKTVEITG